MDFYHSAALVLQDAASRRGSVKALAVAQAQRDARKRGEQDAMSIAKRYLRVVLQTLAHGKALKRILDGSKILTREADIFMPPSALASVKPGKASTAKQAIVKDDKRRRADPEWLARVLVHDLLFSKRGISLPRTHQVRARLDAQLPALKKELAKLEKSGELAELISARAATGSKGADARKPQTIAQTHDAAERGEGADRRVRWLRVNTAKWSLESAIDWLDAHGWQLVDSPRDVMDADKHDTVFSFDTDIEPLLAFPAAVSLDVRAPRRRQRPSKRRKLDETGAAAADASDDEVEDDGETIADAYADARFIAQDKASCIPAWVLLFRFLSDRAEAAERAEAGADEGENDSPEKSKRQKPLRVLDATAAPGNKSTMAGALLLDPDVQVDDKRRTLGTVTAVERDNGRFGVLRDMVKRSACTNVHPLHADVLALDPKSAKLKNVTHILVDPSCSGSGIPTSKRADAEDEEQADASLDETRLRKLANFQCAILSHALRLSNARRVVYSTCSINSIENEEVVRRVLRKPDLIARGWRLAPRDEVVANWPRRGDVDACEGDKEFADSLVRCDVSDGTNGFFVACLTREDAAEAEVADETVDGAEQVLDDAAGEEVPTATAAAKPSAAKSAPVAGSDDDDDDEPQRKKRYTKRGKRGGGGKKRKHQD